MALMKFVSILLLSSIAVQSKHTKEHVAEEVPELQTEVDLSHFCKKTGIFPNPNDHSGETFIRCQLESIEMKCLDGYHFDQRHQTCVSNSVEKFNELHDLWYQILPCPIGERDNFYRNPFDCSMFYRCYQQDKFYRMAVHYCLPNMVFDEALKTCVTEEQFRDYNFGETCQAEKLPKKYKHLLHNAESLDHERYQSEYQLSQILSRFKDVFHA